METTRTEDVRKVVNTAKEQVRTSLLAALGASSLAGRAVADTVAKAKTRVNSSSEAAKKNVEELPAELEELRGRLEPAELRKTLDEYTDAALKLYRRLAASGEQTWGEVVEPQVKRGIEQIEEALRAAQQRVDGAATDARERVDEMVKLLMRRGHEDQEADASSGVSDESTEKPGPVKAESVESIGVVEAARSAREKVMRPGTSRTVTSTEQRNNGTRSKGDTTGSN
ncbi:hypothetical protein [Saccharomonospora sp.]|uniref:hypothetical protein n=1 Tax=Saccharomonospora sp. TaxID=33913 RepID=UPI002629C385|nr:hypothetical protein [Saccharomonospora sp.]